MSEELKCECGNNTATDGFVPCDDTGKEIEPTINSDWNGQYVCQSCGKIHKLDEK